MKLNLMGTTQGVLGAAGLSRLGASGVLTLLLTCFFFFFVISQSSLDSELSVECLVLFFFFRLEVGVAFPACLFGGLFSLKKETSGSGSESEQLLEYLVFSSRLDFMRASIASDFWREWYDCTGFTFLPDRVVCGVFSTGVDVLDLVKFD